MASLGQFAADVEAGRVAGAGVCRHEWAASLATSEAARTVRGTAVK